MIKNFDFSDDLRRLRAACAVGALGSTVQAAQALRLSQSSVVRAIQELEAACGFALFDRNGRGMQPTPDGAALLERAGRALAHLAVLGGPEGRVGVHGLSWLLSRFATGLAGRQMQVLKALAATLSLPAAAQQLGVGAPAVHQSLGQIEHLAGTALFQRSRRGLRLTEAGEEAVRAVQLAQAELAQAAQALSLRQGRLQGRLVIGMLPFSSFMLPRALQAVLAEHPGLQVSVVDGTYESLVQQLRCAELDLVLGALRPGPPPQGLLHEPLFEDRLAVVARRGHPLGGRQGLAWPDLGQAQWILPMPQTPAQAAFDEALAAVGLPPPADALRVNSPLLMLALLAESDRLALMPPRQVRRELDAGLLVALPLELPHRPRSLGLLLRADYLPPPGALGLLEALRASGQQAQQDPGAPVG